MRRMAEIIAPDRHGIARAAELLRRGAFVAFGTETVYGLGADATNDTAVAAVFAAKGRPSFNPLICHYPDAQSAFAHLAASEQARLIAEALWPGPVTMILPRLPDCPISLLASAGLDTVAARVPEPAVTRALLAAASTPIVGPSANRSGRVSPTTVAHVIADLGERIDAVLDQGPCPIGIESTVLDMTRDRPVLLRFGGCSREAIERLVGPIQLASEHDTDGAALRSPGLLRSHYAPRLPVRTDATEVDADEALLAFGPALPGAGAAYQLSETRDLAEAAARLFAGLRELDSLGATRGLTGIAAMPVPDVGLGAAIRDRLARAAAPRDD
jgi:L-threonylcarbamoyladenylate synthase